MEQRKILMISSDNSPISGAFLSMVSLCKLLQNDFGFTPMVVLPFKGEGTRLLDKAAIKYKQIRSYSWVIPMDQRKTIPHFLRVLLKKALNQISVARIVRLLRKESCILLHINTSYSYVGALAAQKTRLPFVWHLRELLEEDQGKTLWNRAKDYTLIQKADRVIAISTCVYKKYASIISPSRLRMILNGIDAECFYRPEKRIFNSSDLIFIYGGGYGDYKGAKDMITAFRLLISRGFLDFRVQLIGEAPDTFRSFVEQNGLSPFVSYMGIQEDVAQFYKNSDIAFCCSRMEAFGRKTVEAMLAGTLVIAADTGGTLDIIKHGETGLLYHHGDPGDLAEMILFAVTHPEEMKKIASGGQAFAVENLTARINAASIAKEYSDIIA